MTLQGKIVTSSEERSAFAQLRACLDSTEPLIVVMHESPHQAYEVIRNLDRIDRFLEVLAGPEFDTRAEESRADALRERLMREAGKVVRLIRAGGYPDQLADSPTWRAVTAAFEARRRQQRRRLLLAAAGVAIGALLLFVVLPRLLPPPVPRANLSEVSERAASGDLQGALAAAQAEQARVPGDPDIALWIAALQQRMGDPASAASWEQARRLFGDDATFYLERGLLLTQLQEYAAAAADARRLIEQPETAAQGHYLLGNIYEARGEINLAVAEFDQAARLADQAKQAELVVAARTRMAYLLQRGALLPAPTP